MIIGIVGLGLIGGSLAKSIKKRTSHLVYGMDIQTSVIHEALQINAIDSVLTSDKISECDILFLALFPQATIHFVREHCDQIKKKGLVLDLCGIKNNICRVLEPIASENGFYFIGAHPMAGREVSGFRSSLDSLFQNASMILTPCNQTPQESIQIVQTLCYQIGFSSIPITTPEDHDRRIALTSQLAHIVSNAYVKSPTAADYVGFAAGSFKDLTRVARLDEVMWSELFLNNRDNLLFEINCLIEHLMEFQRSIQDNDYEQLTQLLKEGREIKETIDERNERPCSSNRL